MTPAVKKAIDKAIKNRGKLLIVAKKNSGVIRYVMQQSRNLKPTKLAVEQLGEDTGPIRSPHHTISPGAILGQPGRPGELELARVLLLDDVSMFKPFIFEVIGDKLKRMKTKPTIIMLDNLERYGALGTVDVVVHEL